MKNIIILLFSIALLATSCKQNENTEPQPETTPSMENLEVSSSFDWKTTKDIQLTLTASMSNLIEVNSSDGTTYQSAFLTANSAYNMKLTVPSYESNVVLKFQGQEVVLELNSDQLEYQFQ